MGASRSRTPGRGFEPAIERALALPHLPLAPTPRTGRALLLLASILALAVLPPITQSEAAPRRGIARVSLPHASSRCWTWKGAEKSFKRQLNDARRSRGLVPLRFDPELSKVARVHTREMVRSASLHHTPSDAFRRRVTNWSVLGENVGVGATPDSLHLAFMNSPPHRANVLYRTYRYVGIGSSQSNGRLWVTVVFEENRDPGTPLRMPRC